MKKSAQNWAGILVKTGTRVEEMDALGDEVKVKVNGPAGVETLVARQTLVAIGFKPNSENLGLEAIGVTVEHVVEKALTVIEKGSKR